MQLVDLVVRAKDGDEAAYGELIRRFQAMAFGYCQPSNLWRPA